MKIYIKRISRRLKSLREEKALTQEELADRLGISRQSIISVEKGKCLPSLPLALRIAQIFEKSFDDLFFENHKKGDENMPRYLTPWSPFRDIDRFFEDEETPTPARWRGMHAWQFPMVNAKETPKEVVLTADIPGIKDEDLNIEVGDNFVDISGERQEEIKNEEEGYFHQEVRFGSFSRRIPLPTEVKSEKAEASIKNGQLIIVIPKLEPEKPKITKIKVKKTN